MVVEGGIPRKVGEAGGAGGSSQERVQFYGQSHGGKLHPDPAGMNVLE